MYQLNEKYLSKVNGGSKNGYRIVDSHHYSDAVYHLAGIILNYQPAGTGYRYHYFCMPDNSMCHPMRIEEADKCVDYLLNHTAQEYIDHVKEVIPNYTCITQGYNIY